MFVVGVVCALLIGVSLGLLGGGGSILTVLILLHVFQLPPRVAIATSLLVVGSTSAAALVPHALAGRVRWKTGALFGAASMAGAYAAGRAAKHLPASALLTLFGAMMLVTATAMLRGRKPANGAAGRATPTDLPVARALAVGLALGAVTGLVGAGGGFLVVPALMLLGGLPMGVAVGTSLLVITLNAFAGLAGYLASVAIPWGTAGAVVSAAVLGSVAGARLVAVIPAERLRAGFAWLVVAMGVLTLGQELSRLFGGRFSLAAHWPWLLAATGLPAAAAALFRAARRPPLTA